MKMDFKMLQAVAFTDFDLIRVRPQGCFLRFQKVPNVTLFIRQPISSRFMYLRYVVLPCAYQPCLITALDINFVP